MEFDNEIFFSGVFSPLRESQGKFWMNLYVKKGRTTFWNFTFPGIFSYCNVSFRFLLKRCQITGFLAEMSSRKKKKKEKFLGNLTSLLLPPADNIWKTRQYLHWSFHVRTISSFKEMPSYGIDPFHSSWKSPLCSYLNNPFTATLPTGNKLNVLCNSAFSLLKRTMHRVQRVKAMKVPLNLLP